MAAVDRMISSAIAAVGELGLAIGGVVLLVLACCARPAFASSERGGLPVAVWLLVALAGAAGVMVLREFD